MICQVCQCIDDEVICVDCGHDKRVKPQIVKSSDGVHTTAVGSNVVQLPVAAKAPEQSDFFALKTKRNVSILAALEEDLRDAESREQELKAELERIRDLRRVVNSLRKRRNNRQKE